jgi:hypothetical protein
MNTELLLKIKAQILKEPRQFLMSGFFDQYLDPVNSDLEDDVATNCGTACCIAGWAVTIGKEYKNPKEAYENSRLLSNTAAEARLLLGIKGEDWLFHTDQWPSQFEDRWDEAKSHEEQAQIAGEVIDYYIKHNGVNLKLEDGD